MVFDRPFGYRSAAAAAAAAAYLSPYEMGAICSPRDIYSTCSIARTDADGLDTCASSLCMHGERPADSCFLDRLMDRSMLQRTVNVV